MRFVPHDYQVRAIEFVASRPYCALFLDMGLGKSVVTLTALRNLQSPLVDEVGKILVIAPKSVARNTWTDECAKWDQIGRAHV